MADDENETVDLQQLTAGVTFYCSKRKGDIPRNAIKAGLSPCGHVYVGVVCHEGVVMPAKIIPAYNITYYAYNGKELSTTDKIYMVVEEGYTYKWVPCSDGHTPHNSAKVGSKDLEPYYVGRVPIDEEKCVGKVLKSRGVCYVPKCGKEYPFRDYDALVIQKLPPATHW